jgi:putative NADH-flavin reductase
LATVLIVGASRGIGLETVKRALEADHKVRALARSARRIPVNHPNLEKVAGDALDPSIVKRALDGADAVIETIGVAPSPAAILKPVRLFSGATRILVELMAEAGVKRLICVTGIGAGDSRDKGGFLYSGVLLPLVLRRVYDDKNVQEQIVRRSALDWVIVRPGMLTRGPRTGSYRVLTNPDEWRMGKISRADVADFLVRQIDDDTYLGKTPLLLG